MNVVLAIVKFLVGWGGLVIGGVYTVVRGFGELVKAVDELYFRFRDYSVFEVIDTPRAREPHLMIRTAIGTVIEVREASAPPPLKPYSVVEIASRTGRKEKSVVASLKRLKRLGKAIQSPSGWYSINTAPPVSARLFR